MEESSIAVIPENGYNLKQNTSNKCQQWLKFLSDKNNILIQHSKNVGELSVGKYFVDGYCEATDTIFVSVVLAWMYKVLL